MAAAWIRSLHCKSVAVDDVYQPTTTPLHHRDLHHRRREPGLLPDLLSLGCGGSTSHALRDVGARPRTATVKRIEKPLPAPAPGQKKPSKPAGRPKPTTAPGGAPPPPTLAELPVGHSSRRVVEIIFGSSWSPSGAPFPGTVEMLFKVRNPPRAVARFEEYRDAVRARAGPGDARCAADGNEMLRFHRAPAGPVATSAGVLFSPGGGGIRTFAGSGGAHEGGGGAGAGRRGAMLVCRVVAGRVGVESSAEFDSVSLGKGELVVFDRRAVLPCFLIIYTVLRPAETHLS